MFSMQVFEERHGYKAIQKEREAKAVEVENIFNRYQFLNSLFSTENIEGETGERGGVGEKESLGLACPKKLLD